MKFVVDMNLSPQWVGFLEGSGHDAVHWSVAGRADAPDSEIVKWAREHDRIVLTCDLDFSGILALSGSHKPSVVQLRSERTLPSLVGVPVLEAIQQAASDLLNGALLTVEIGRSRLRILPLVSEQ